MLKTLRCAERGRKTDNDKSSTFLSCDSIRRSTQSEGAPSRSHFLLFVRSFIRLNFVNKKTFARLEKEE